MHAAAAHGHTCRCVASTVLRDCGAAPCLATNLERPKKSQRRLTTLPAGRTCRARIEQTLTVMTGSRTWTSPDVWAAAFKPVKP
eukprot:362938-Chlamydomonas_euryale.AAC.7